MKKKLYDNGYLILFLITVVICHFFCWRYGVFGSKVDWISQHSVIPDYFRKQFYETGNFFPEFAANIGAGQNIYYFSYYGLYSPIILFSYLLPFVKMSDYLMATQFLCLVSSVLLMYRWLKNQEFSKKICIGIALLYLLAGPMIFHSYSQIMFVNYMPFLCLAFQSVDRYFKDQEQRKGGCLVVSVFLMIMTSFYFSIGGMLAVTLYGIYRYFMMCEKRDLVVTVKEFLKEGIRFALHIITAVCMSGILLIPTAMVLTGRESTGIEIGIKDVLLPNVPLTRFLYNPYGIGLTTLAITVVLAMLFFPKRYEKILAWGCVIILTIPVFAYLLNGGLYVRDKAMIPFLPLLCYMIAYYLNRLEQEQSDHAFGWLPYIATLILLTVQKDSMSNVDSWKLIFADGIIMLGAYLIFVKKRSVMLFVVPSVTFLFLFGCVFHIKENKFLERDFYEEVTDEEIGTQIKEILESDDGYYRIEQLGDSTQRGASLNRIWDIGQYSSSIYSSIYNENYQEFRKETFQLEQTYRNFLMQPASLNPIYRKFMGVKYTITDKKVDKEEAASPIAYATDQVVSESEYKKLKFPYCQDALLQYAVVPEEGKEADWNWKHVDEVKMKLPSEIQSDKDVKQSVKISQKAAGKDQVIGVAFRVENLRPNKDVSVWINGMRNKLTSKRHFYYNDNTVFHFVVPVRDGEDTIEITFGAGHYKLSDVQSYMIDLASEEKNNSLYQSEFQVDKEKTKGNQISGTMDVKRSGYFITSIPYDSNFELTVDGKDTKKEKVNTAFLGCKIEQGKHTIEITYHAPGVNAGKVCSLIGVGLFLFLLSGRWYHKK